MKGKRQRGRGYIIRLLLLTAEVLFISLGLLGERGVMTQGIQEGMVQDEVITDTREAAPAASETPAFSWEDYKVTAHALGGLEGNAYLNSRESFLTYYAKGCRLFEVDLVKTSDGEWVCRHSWNSPLGQWEGEESRVLTLEEFLAAPLYGKYTPMSLEDLFLLLKDYPDAFVLLDSKQYSVRNYQRTLEDYTDYIELANSLGAGQVLDQLVPEIYNEAMFSGTALLHEFPGYIYSLWQEYTLEELEAIAAFCREKGIGAATVNESWWSAEVQKIFDEQGILLYIYTVNDSEKAMEYMEQGAAGVCSDYLLEEDIS